MSTPSTQPTQPSQPPTPQRAAQDVTILFSLFIVCMFSCLLNTILFYAVVIAGRDRPRSRVLLLTNLGTNALLAGLLAYVTAVVGSDQSNVGLSPMACDITGVGVLVCVCLNECAVAGVAVDRFWVMFGGRGVKVRRHGGAKGAGGDKSGTARSSVASSVSSVDVVGIKDHTATRRHDRVFYTLCTVILVVLTITVCILGLPSAILNTDGSSDSFVMGASRTFCWLAFESVRPTTLIASLLVVAVLIFSPLSTLVLFQMMATRMSLITTSEYKSAGSTAGLTSHTSPSRRASGVGSSVSRPGSQQQQQQSQTGSQQQTPGIMVTSSSISSLSGIAPRSALPTPTSSNIGISSAVAQAATSTSPHAILRLKWSLTRLLMLPVAATHVLRLYPTIVITAAVLSSVAMSQQSDMLVLVLLVVNTFVHPLLLYLFDVKVKASYMLAWTYGWRKRSGGQADAASVSGSVIASVAGAGVTGSRWGVGSFQLSSIGGLGLPNNPNNSFNMDMYGGMSGSGSAGADGRITFHDERVRVEQGGVEILPVIVEADEMDYDVTDDEEDGGNDDDDAGGGKEDHFMRKDGEPAPAEDDRTSPSDLHPGQE
ncbi:hypothetical protein BC831DRAFT_447175 [Entophlyctis helioformis]|nr:hypothetical protein BC831DRAFT_447175 [Entophlyctis helioformis]